MGAADFLTQAHAALEADRAREQRRRSQIVRSYLLAEGLVFAAYAIFLLRLPGAMYPWLSLVCGLTAVGMFFAIRIEILGRHTLAGVLSQVIPIAPVMALASAFSVEAGFGSLLFIGALAVVVMVPDEQARVRFVIVGALIVAVVVLQVVFDRNRAWASLPVADTAAMSTVNRTIMTIALFALALVLNQRARIAKDLVAQALNLAQMAGNTDALTGLATRRPVWAHLDELDAARADYTVAMVDIDHFKKLNDAFGHDCGDEALVQVANSMVEHVRAVDLVGRWGGEEFLIVVTGARVEEATLILERVRKAIAALVPDCGGPTHSVTVSAGLAQRRTGETAAEVVGRADAALYLAKQQGRNRVMS